MQCTDLTKHIVNTRTIEEINQATTNISIFFFLYNLFVLININLKETKSYNFSSYFFSSPNNTFYYINWFDLENPFFSNLESNTYTIYI